MRLEHHASYILRDLSSRTLESYRIAEHRHTVAEHAVPELVSAEPLAADHKSADRVDVEPELPFAERKNSVAEHELAERK